MKNKYYFAVSLEGIAHEGMFVENLYKEIQTNLQNFFDLPVLIPKKDLHVTLIPPFEVEDTVFEPRMDFIARSLKQRKLGRIYWDEFIELDHNGKSFGWKFEASDVVEKIIKILHEILRGQQIVLSKNVNATLETLHATLIKECDDTAVYQKAVSYIKLHYPKFDHRLIVKRVFLYKKNTDQTWEIVQEFSTKESF